MSSDESSELPSGDDASSVASDDSLSSAEESDVEEGREHAPPAEDDEDAAFADGPAVEAAAMDEWYENEVHSLRLTAYSVANKLRVEEDDVPFETAVRSLDSVLDLVVAAPTAAQRQQEVLGSTQPQFFLTVRGDAVQVVYGVRLCHLLQNRVVALMGDRRRTNNIMREPNVMVVEGEAAVQTRVFGSIKIAAKQVQTIREELEEMDDGGYLVNRAAVGNKLKTPKLLPVHPKLAVLFLRGVKIPQALEMVQDLSGQFGEEIDLLLGPLENFCRAAATSHTGRSSVAIDWALVQLGENEALDEWCSGLICQWVPRTDNGKPAARVERIRHDRDQHDNTRELIQAVHSLSRKVGSPEKETQHKFADYQLEIYAAATVGVDEQEMAADVHLSPFYEGLRAIRGRATDVVRGYIEKQLKQTHSTDPEAEQEFTVTVSSQLLKAIRDMNFSGSDDACSWELREQGLSLFSLAPVPFGMAGIARQARDKCVAFESTASQHRPTDAMEQTRLSTTIEPWPKTWERIRAWLLAFCRHTDTIFGNQFIGRPILREILGLMRQPWTWVSYQQEHYMALAWKLHMGIRQIFLKEGQTFGILRRVRQDLEDGNPPRVDSLPLDVQAHIRASTPLQDHSKSGKGNKASPREADQASGNASKKLRETVETITGPKFAKEWEAEIAKVREAMPTLTGKAFCSSTDEIKKLFGPEFLGLMPLGKTPCMTYFIMNRCYSDCRRNHEITAYPSPQIIAGIRERVKERCRQLVAQSKTSRRGRTSRHRLLASTEN